jgi:aspartate/methionine/tyrosine aminotransferase
MKLAERISRLGTETAFLVSAEAAAHGAKGNRIFPFHLGDINIRTGDNIIAATHKAMLDAKTGYCPNAGITPLREALAEHINATRHTSYTMENVAIQPGGKPSIGKFLLALMNPGDEVLYPNPGFPIYESQIEFHGGKAVPYGFKEGATTFEILVDQIEESITPKTRILILNDLHNPSSAEASAEELKRLADVANRHDLYVLADEAYFDIRYSGDSRSIVSLPGMVERTMILYTFSKKFAMTGWRLGGSIGPKELIEMVIKMNVNDESCSNHFVQYGAIEALTGDQSTCQRIIDTLRTRRDKAVEILNSIEGVHCYRPEATFYLYPNVTEVMKRTAGDDYDAFRTMALQETGVSFCTRMHFGRPFKGESQRHIRLAYSGIDIGEIEEGLTLLKGLVER